MLRTAPVPVPAPPGREREAVTLQRFAEGETGALIVTGEPGIGKTTLLAHVFDAAAGDVRVERIAAVESELELPYAGLHLLCSRVADDLERLPAPQRQALDAAFGLEPMIVPSPLLLGLGVLSALAHAASEHPLVCIVDDAQWLDDASAQVLGFVARRLGAEPVAL